MTSEWALVILGLLGITGGLFAYLLNANSRFAVLETKVEQLGKLETRMNDLCDILIQQGKVQVVTGKMGRANSPVRLFDAAYRYFDDLAPSLKNFYIEFVGMFRYSHAGAVRVQELDRELFGAVAMHFKEPITKICNEHSLPFLGAVLMAVEVAKGSMTIEQAFAVGANKTVPLIGQSQDAKGAVNGSGAADCAH